MDLHTFITDLWTTRCTRCPAALDALNDFATTNLFSADDDQQVQCLSICCGDSIDGAREIIEAPQVPRWNAMHHYFMAFNDKERAKLLLNFRQVPFYIVFDRMGNMRYSGNKKPENFNVLFKDKKAEYMARESPTSAVDPLKPHAAVVTELFINDMDF